MSKQVDKLKKFDLLITETLREVLLMRNDAWSFIKTEHTADETQQRLNDARDYGARISGDAILLVDYKKANSRHAKQIDALLDRYDSFNAYLRDIQECLDRDLDKLKKELEAKKVDHIKIGSFIIAVPVGFAAIVHNGVGNNKITENEAAAIGLMVALPIAFQKSVRNFFSKAAKTACNAPAAIQNSFEVYYAKEIFKESSQAAQLCFATAAKAINDNMWGGIRKTMRLGKNLRLRGPKP